MDKLLMMSILSSSPAEVSGSWWTNLSVSIQNSKKKVGGDDENSRKIGGGGSSAGGSDHHHQQKQRQKQGLRPAMPRCAPELDGLHCFETFVSH